MSKSRLSFLLPGLKKIELQTYCLVVAKKKKNQTNNTGIYKVKVPCNPSTKTYTYAQTTKTVNAFADPFSLNIHLYMESQYFYYLKYFLVTHII